VARAIPAHFVVFFLPLFRPFFCGDLLLSTPPLVLDFLKGLRFPETPLLPLVPLPPGPRFQRFALLHPRRRSETRLLFYFLSVVFFLLRLLRFTVEKVEYGVRSRFYFSSSIFFSPFWDPAIFAVLELFGGPGPAEGFGKWIGV